MTEAEIKKELQERDVVEVHRVMVKRDTEKVPTNTLLLTFSTPEMPMEIMVSYLKVKVALFRTGCVAATATNLATRANVSKLLQSVIGAVTQAVL